jgi:predicted ATPase
MRFEIKNFRSIKEQEIELAPITVVYGPNGSGKSSLLYALLTLKNVVLNPYQTPNEFFNYMFTNLGGFDAVVFDHQTRNEIELGVTLEKDGIFLTYQVIIGENKGSFALSVECSDFDAKFQLPVSFPYPANRQTQQTIPHKERIFIVTWNGITAEVRTETQEYQVQKEAIRLAASLNVPIEMLRKVSIVPLKRGFSKPFYSSVPVSPMMITEDEIATFLSMNKRLVSKLSFYLEQILERDFRVNFKPGIAVFSLDCTDKKTGVASEIVNEGFGVNQIAYLLARCLHNDTEWVCIEEPEIHLHPTAVRRVAKALVQIIRNEGKGFVISTHSESFLLALLTLVAQGELEPSELACYLARKEKKSTQFERQSVNEKGQIEGGLTSFLEGELEDVATFLGVAK